ncbi:MAG: UDP-N-acetylglucosamine 1-carboxyvinyltransferase [Actinomycetota bacterium]|nr:UDP-N-acetylglucosamine 1-carboxyvinyltransferase [Actinomycetota bacterium]
MNKIIVRGGNPLVGEVKISGAKNSALKIMAASILTSEPVVIGNVPYIRDVSVMSEVLGELGLSVERTNGSVTLQAKGPIGMEAPYQLVSQMRASIIVLGPLLARLGRARVAMPGGCNIGLRKIDLHIRGLEMLGAKIDVGQASIEARADVLVGANIPLDFPSVGATENIMMAACLARGTTVLDNAAREPEIVDLADCLNQMGACISGAGTSTMIIEGVDRLHGVSFNIIPDRIEAGTFLVAGAITGGDLTVTSVKPEQMGMVLKKLEQIGYKVDVGDSTVNIKGAGGPCGINISTLPHPGFPTDMQASFMSLLSLAEGTSIITENIFENRFSFVQELNHLGGRVNIERHHAVVIGKRTFGAGTVKAPDLRAGAALVVAGLAAGGLVEISDIHHIERGYENFTGRLQVLGADIELAPDERPLELAVKEEEGYDIPDISAGL